MFICSAIDSVTRFTTNSRVSRMLRVVSFGRAWRSPMDTPRTIGWLETPMLYENGAQLSIPLRLTVETKAMGRGMKAEIMRRYAWRSGTDEGSKIMREPPRRNDGRAIRIPSMRTSCLSRRTAVPGVNHGDRRVHPALRSRLRHLQRAEPLDWRRGPSTSDSSPDDPILAGAAPWHSRCAHARRLPYRRAERSIAGGGRRGPDPHRRVADGCWVRTYPAWHSG